MEAAPFRRALLRWYRAHARVLPWRSDPAPYKVWISEILLQQTRVDQGIGYFERFLKAFPNVETLAHAPLDRVLKCWEGLGYYARARNLHRAAQIIVSERGGRLPETPEEWRALPGIGRYTAGAIASIAYGAREPVLDGNVIRVLSRVLDLDACVDTADVQATLWDVAERLLPRNAPGDFNQAMMELGALVCTPRSPSCAECPVRAHCRASAQGTQEQRPVRKEKRPVPHQEIAVGVIERAGRVLIGRRKPGGLLGGLWEFPGGRVESGETAEEALRRELREELGVEVAGIAPLTDVTHAYSHLRVTLHVFRCRLRRGTPRANVHDALEWVLRDELTQYAFPKANLKFLHLV